MSLQPQQQTDLKNIPSVELRAPLVIDKIKNPNIEDEESVAVTNLKSENKLMFIAGTFLTIVFIIVSAVLGYIYFIK